MNTATKIQAVINTLGLLEIRATKENVSRLTGIYKALEEVQAEVENNEADHE